MGVYSCGPGLYAHSTVTDWSVCSTGTENTCQSLGHGQAFLRKTDRLCYCKDFRQTASNDGTMLRCLPIVATMLRRNLTWTLYDSKEWLIRFPARASSSPSEEHLQAQSQHTFLAESQPTCRNIAQKVAR